MALNLKNPMVERLAAEVAAHTGESKTEAIRQALLERSERLGLAGASMDRGVRIQRFLEHEAWPRVPADELGRVWTKGQLEELLGFDQEDEP